ncbi:hypothetical protein HD806DRAFT_507619 [Xylariaceae sp. AK1471]|nr:hypothetical protein HD806DRAFT_507619 [Xylariaceae sp. AK1471]
MIPTAKDMLSSLLRPKPAARRIDSRLFDSNAHTQHPDPASREHRQQRHAIADFTEDEDEEEEAEDHDEGHNEDEFDPNHQSIRFADQPTNRRRNANPNPAIPLFSANHLDSLPVYNVVHAIRIIVQARTETSLSWEQLRSPQVSQFLVKPMQQQIRTQHFSRVTLYALMANCLQFGKEGQLYPGDTGVSSTRAKVCELLALKLLKEYSTRELIDALSYDFDPLQGSPSTPPTPNGRTPQSRATTPPARQLAKSSTLEVAILASAKHFVSHPLVVQQLEAIWSGAITFYSSHDNLHRTQAAATGAPRSDQRVNADARTPLLGHHPFKELSSQLPLHAIPVRRTVALYDPRNASLLKLSRLRVPRYRDFLSTCSLFVMICLFLAVLTEHSSRITSLELLFWFWSAGFMLDEVVGFNEQGFSLYIMSYWNVVDLGILLLLIIYYGMRLTGVFLVDSVRWNEMAYEVLAANAIFLLPRIFSVLDHYPYFSQLLIAFRYMVEDLMAVFVLILISCSGFFVFFTLSKNEDDATDVAYRIFQILMGFTPAAWDVWPEYTFVGRLLLIFFLIICHFLVVTILITVLTNSFTAIASNAKEEHLFLFAINTISMVKNDSLFSYIAPANILAWVLTPLRYIMPIRQFILLNRTVIKLTHWPILFLIFVYEKYFLASSIYEPTDLVERRKSRSFSIVDSASRGAGLFSPNIRTREESIAGFQKDQALDEVFRRQPDTTTIRTQMRQERRKTQTAIRDWMDQSDEIGERLTRWPTIESRPSHSLRRMSMSRELSRQFRTLSDVRSAASDPADLMSNHGFPPTGVDGFNTQRAEHQSKDLTDADGDDELVTNDEDEDEDEEIAGESRQENRSHADQEEDYFTTSMASRRETMIPSPIESVGHHPTVTISPKTGGATRRQGLHRRTLSTNTILYNPQEANRHGPSSPLILEGPAGLRSHPRTSRLCTTIEHPASAGTRSPRRTTQYVTANSALPRPISMKPAPNRTTPLTGDPRRQHRKLSFNSDTTGHLADAKNKFGAVPSSFATQMAMATGQLRAKRTVSAEREREDADRMGRLVLARMKTLEESFADVVREVQLMRSGVPTAQNSADDESRQGSGIGLPEVNLSVPARKRFTRRIRKARKSRPASVKEEKVGMGGTVTPQKQTTKGKGKAILRRDDTESENELATTFMRRGSSL